MYLAWNTCLSCHDGITLNQLFCPHCQMLLKSEFVSEWETSPQAQLTLFRYRGAIQKLIVNEKQKRPEEVHPNLKTFLDSCAEKIKCRIRLPKQMSQQLLIVALPAHPLRQITEHNLCASWALSLSQSLQIPLAHRWMTYGSPWQRPQKLKSQSERSEGLRFSLTLKARQGPPSQIILVDDVCSTGSSLVAAKELLQNAGHQVIHQVVLAHTEPLIDRKRRGPFEHAR